MIEQHGSLAEKFIKKGFWLYLFTFIVAPMGYIVKITISTDLSVPDVGLLYGIISLVVLVSAYHDFGITESIYYFIPKFITENRYDKVKTIFFGGILIQVISGIIIASFFFFGSQFLADYYFKSIEAIQLLKIFALYFLIINFLQIIATFFMAIQNTFYTKLVELVRMGFTLTSTILLFLFDLGSLINYSYAWLLGVVLGTIFSVYIFYIKYYKIYLKDIKFNIDKTLIKEIIKYSLFVFLGAQAGTILSQIDMQMIIYMLGTTDAGYYTNYLSIINIPFMIIGPVFGLLLPVISELYGKKDIHKIKLMKTIFTKNFISISIFSNTIFFVFAEIIAFILFGEKFIMSGTILKYSVLFLIFNYLLHINFQIMSGTGKVKFKLIIMIVAILSNILTTYFLINNLGVAGASLAAGLGWIIIWLLSEYYLGKEYIIKYDYISLIKNIFVFFLTGLLSYYLIIPNLEDKGRIELLFFMILISFIYLLIYIVTNYFEIKKFINEVKNVKKSLK